MPDMDPFRQRPAAADVLPDELLARVLNSGMREQR